VDPVGASAESCDQILEPGQDLEAGIDQLHGRRQALRRPRGRRPPLEVLASNQDELVGLAAGAGQSGPGLAAEAADRDQDAEAGVRLVVAYLGLEVADLVGADRGGPVLALDEEETRLEFLPNSVVDVVVDDQVDLLSPSRSRRWLTIRSGWDWKITAISSSRTRPFASALGAASSCCINWRASPRAARRRMSGSFSLRTLKTRV
jgi:hypothetical protein